MKVPMRTAALILGVALAGSLSVPCQSSPFDMGPAPRPGTNTAANAAGSPDTRGLNVPVDAARLDRARGGFTTAQGLTIALGIERVVSINGTEVARSSMELRDLAHLDQAQAAAARAALGAVQLVQNGPQNTALTQWPDAALGGVIIQNTLSDQAIRAQTIINTSVNSASLLHALNLNTSLADALRGALGPR